MFGDFKLKVFLKVAETGGFTTAARKLGISQPAVSQNIGSLEDEIGVRLFERKRGTVYLTPSGQAFLEYAKKIQYWYDTTSLMFGDCGRASTGRPVRIAADTAVTDYLLAPALSTIHAVHPGLSFSLENLHTEDLAPRGMIPLENVRIPVDVEITAGPNPKTVDFDVEGRMPGMMDAVAVASPDNRELAPAAAARTGDHGPKPFSTLAGIPISDRFAVWDHYRSFLAPDLAARTALVSSSAESIKSVVASSPDLVGIVPAVSVRRELTSGVLQLLPIALPEFNIGIHFNPSRDFSNTQICNLLISAISNLLK